MWGKAECDKGLRRGPGVKWGSEEVLVAERQRKTVLGKASWRRWHPPKTVLKDEKILTGSDVRKKDRLLESRKSSTVGKYRAFLSSRSPGMDGSEDTSGSNVRWDRQGGLEYQGRPYKARKPAPDPATTGNLTRCSEWRVMGSEPSLRKMNPFTWTLVQKEPEDRRINYMWKSSRREVFKLQKRKAEKVKTVGCKKLIELDIWLDTESKRLHSWSPSGMSVYLLSQLPYG